MREDVTFVRPGWRQIRGGQLRLFAPFANRDYTNTWGHQLRIDPRYADLQEVR